MDNYSKIYFIGIEGAGTSALAQMYKSLGYEVLGSDDGDHFYGDFLKRSNIQVFDKFDASNLPSDADLIVYSTAFKDDNPEMAAAKSRGIKMLSYSEALGELFENKMGIAVCGTHGKTTTSAILAQALKDAGESPSAIIGSKVTEWNSNFLVGESDYFVIEADEYQNKLQHYNPFSVILTSLDYDHPDFFPDFTSYKKAFEDFIKKIPKHGILIYNNDDRDVIEIAQKANCSKISYGFTEDSDLKIFNRKLKDGYQFFDISLHDENLGEFKLKLPGKHNILNAASSIAFAQKFKLDLQKIKKSLENFKGTVRRFEYIGEKNGAILIDDYAHHPEEIKTTLKAAREIYSNKEIWTIFHPHSFTRTEALLSEFSQSFDDSDKVYIIDVYGSAREEKGNVNSKDLVDLINKYTPGKAEYIPSLEEITNLLSSEIKKGQLIISMGAGDVWKVTHKLVK